MAFLPARVWRKFVSSVLDTNDPTKIGSGKWNDELNIDLGTICGALALLNASGDKVPFFTGASSADLATLTNFGRLIIASNDNAAARSLLGAVNIAGDTMTGNLSFGGFNKVTGLAAPSNATDAVRKADLDAVVSAIAGALIFQGSWDPSTGVFPGAGAAALGWFWKASADGTCGGKFFSAGDDVYAVVANASTSTYAGNWLKIEGSITKVEVEAAVGFTFGTLAAASGVTVAQITNATADGRSLISAANYAAMLTLLGLATVATSGSYADLTAKPTLGTAAALDVGTSANKVVQLDGSSKLPPVDASQLQNLPASSAAPSELVITEQQSSGTDPGYSASGTATVTRRLNTVVANSISGASLSLYQATLPAGTYDVEFTAPASSVSLHQSAFKNVTDGVVVGIGESATATVGSAVQTHSRGVGRFTIAASKVFELQHWSSGGDGGSGILGRKTTSGYGEVYARCKITKVA